MFQGNVRKIYGVDQVKKERLSETKKQDIQNPAQSEGEHVLRVTRRRGIKEKKNDAVTTTEEKGGKGKRWV